MKLKLLAIICVASLIGCATPKQVRLDSATRTPTTRVDVFREGSKPDRRFKEISEISFEDFGGEDARAQQRIIDFAKTIGADAVIFQPRKDTGYNFNMFGRSGNRYLFKAVAVAYDP